VAPGGFGQPSDDTSAVPLRPVYAAPSTEAAETALLELGESALGRRYPASVKVFSDAWERFTPFLAFPPAVRKLIYTTNSIESLNYQLRKIIKNRGHFPTDDAAVKLLWLAIMNVEDKRAAERAVNEPSGPTANLTPPPPNKPPEDWSKGNSSTAGNQP